MTRIVAALWCAEYGYTLSELLEIAVDVKRLQRMLTKEDSDHFYFGSKPFLYARKVTHLRSDEQNGVHTLCWKETPILRLNRENYETEVVLEGRDSSFSQHQDEAISRR